MTFDELVCAEAVAFESRATTRPAVLQRLSALMARVTGATPARVRAALDAREALGTTGFGGGCAIPHGRLAGLSAMVGGVVRLARPVDWNAVDGQPVDLLFVLLGPDTPGPEHLKALARVSRACRDRTFLAKLRGAADPAALFALLTDAPGQVLTAA